jgi:hypothetical protein
MAGCPASMLGSLIAKVAVVGCRVGDMPRPGVVNHSFADLRQAGSEAMNEHQDKEDPHDDTDSSGAEAPGQTASSASSRDPGPCHGGFLVASVRPAHAPSPCTLADQRGGSPASA